MIIPMRAIFVISIASILCGGCIERFKSKEEIQLSCPAYVQYLQELRGGNQAQFDMDKLDLSFDLEKECGLKPDESD